MLPRVVTLVGFARAGIVLALAMASATAAEPSSADVRELIEQNRRLMEQVQAQQKTIDELNSKVTDVLKASDRHDRELRGLREQVEAPAGPAASTGNRDQQVRISAEAGMAFFNTGSEGQFPKQEFRVDEPVITLEAPVAKNVYFYTELKLLTRETNVENFQLGEIYADFEDVSSLWGQPGLMSFRAGRINIPFGEEYQVRGIMANPLISRSISDIWGVDEGAEIYGKVGPVRYVLAVQNGGSSRLRDFNADKSVTARLSWEPLPWLHLSGSAMRTGELATVADNLSEVWFANGFFRALGPAASTGTFWADLAEGDAKAHWKNGQVLAAYGEVKFDDSDTRADNSRQMRYGYLELMQGISEHFYGAVRYSEISAPGGYPLAGWGRMGLYFFRPVLTEALRRFSVGVGYHLGPSVLLKAEYSAESGSMTTGAPRDKEDFFGSEIAVRF